MSFYSLDIDEEFYNHLGNPDSWGYLQKEEFSSELIEDDDIRKIYDYAVAYRHRFGNYPAPSVLVDESGKTLYEPETHLDDLIERMRARYVKNRGRDVIRELGEFLRDHPGDTHLYEELLQKGKHLRSLVSSKGNIIAINDFEKVRADYDKKLQRGPGVSLGFDELTEYFYGMSGITFFIAPPKTFKTFVLLHTVLDNVRKGRAVDFYSLELPVEQADMRLRCLMSGVPFWRYIRNWLEPQHLEAMQRASEELAQHGSYRIIKPDVGHRTIEEMVYKSLDHGSDAVFIDQLQYVEISKGRSLGAMNNTGDYWHVLNQARDFSDDIPICFAHQFNRQAMFADDMPPIEYAKGSSAIEEVSTLALGIWGNSDMRQHNYVMLSTLISRNHMLADWEMGYDLTQKCEFEILGRVDHSNDGDDDG